MAQAYFKVLQATYRPDSFFDQEGKKQQASKLYMPGMNDETGQPNLYVCDEEEAVKHALSIALEPFNDVAKAAKEKALGIQKERERKSLEERSAADPTNIRIRELEAKLERLLAAMPPPAPAKAQAGK